MVNDHCLLFKTRDVSQTMLLGQVFSESFLSPLLLSSTTPSSLVTLYYGAQSSGKSAFLEGFSGVFKGVVRELFDRQSVKAELSRGDLLFRHMDQGCFTYPGLIGVPAHEVKRFSPTPPDYWLLDNTQLSPRKRENIAGLDMIEHASIPHLLGGDVAIVGVPMDYDDAVGGYYRKFSQFLSENLKKETPCETYPFMDWDVSRKKAVLEKFLPVLNSVPNLNAGKTQAKETDRLFFAVLLSDEQPKREAFKAFQGIAKSLSLTF